MVRKSRQVDLGPMYLPVGEDTGFAVERAGLAEEADRFARLLDVAPRRAGHGASQSHDPPEHGPSVSDLASHVQSLWERESDGPDSEVRVIPGMDVSPHTTLRLQMREGTLHIGIHCDASANTGWFIPRLASLGRDLATRLHLPVGVALFASNGDRIGHFDPSEGNA